MGQWRLLILPRLHRRTVIGGMVDDSADTMLTLRLNLAKTGPFASDAKAAYEASAGVGVRFFTLAEVGDSPESRRRLYELVFEGVVDDPSNDGTFMEFEEFSENLFEPFYWRWAECQFIAAVGDEWIGLTNVQVREDGAVFGVTVVKRSFRGRGVARALKLLALDYLWTRGVETVETRNHPSNEAVLKLNRRLGFEG